MIIQYPEDEFKVERKYTLELLFNDFLGGSFKFEGDKKLKDYHIIFDGKEIVIKDVFFSESKQKYYEDLNSIPVHAFEFTSKLGKSLDLIYGFDHEELGTSGAFLGADIVGSAYYLLSGWEECTLQLHGKVDIHGRAVEDELFLIRNGLYKKPLINEYVEYLRVLFQFYGVEVKNPHKYKMVLTHDVDHIYKWKSLKGMVRSLGGLLLKGELMLVIFSLWNILSSRLNKAKDVYFNFNKILDILKENKLSAYFFFMAANPSGRDDGYRVDDENLKKVLSQINNEGHCIGFHPGYYTSAHKEEFDRQLLELKKVSASEVICGRQHYLKYQMPSTFKIWENAGFQWDSSRGFNSRVGFKCGVCYSFPIIDFQEVRVLNITEKPLIFMETNTFSKFSTSEELLEEIEGIVSLVKKYSGDFVALWHNSNFIFPPYKNGLYFYKKLIKIGR